MIQSAIKKVVNGLNEIRYRVGNSAARKELIKDYEEDIRNRPGVFRANMLDWKPDLDHPNPLNEKKGLLRRRPNYSSETVNTIDLRQLSEDQILKVEASHPSASYWVKFSMNEETGKMMVYYYGVNSDIPLTASINPDYRGGYLFSTEKENPNNADHSFPYFQNEDGIPMEGQGVWFDTIQRLYLLTRVK